MKNYISLFSALFLIANVIWSSPNTMAGNVPAYIHETSETKVITVQSLSHLRLYEVRDDYFLVYEEGTGDTYIFDKTGTLTARLILGEAPEYPITENRIAVKLKDGQQALLDSKGDIIASLDSKVNGLSEFDCGLAVGQAVKKSSFGEGFYYANYGLYVDQKGVIVKPELHIYKSTPSIYNFYRWYNRMELYPLRYGRRLHHDANTSLYGYLDSDLSVIIPFQFTDAHSFSEDLAAVAIEKGYDVLWGFIDINGNWIIPPRYSKEPGDFHNGYAVVEKKNGYCVYIDKNGNICSPEYYAADRFINGYAGIRSDNRSAPSIIDESFSVVQKDLLFGEYKYCEGTNTIFADGMVFSAKFKDLELLLQPEGQYHCDPFYTEITRYFEDYRARGYINMKGEIILKFVETEF